ncbi:MAG: hypothetical protein ACSHW4_13040 [Cellulophaga sp.]
MKKIISVILVFLINVGLNAQNSYPENGNVVLRKSAGTYRSFDVVNANNYVVSRLEATTDETGQIWLKDANGNYKVVIRSNNLPSSISGELVLGEYAISSKGKILFVNGKSQFTDKVGIGTSNPTALLEIRQKENPNLDEGLIISEPNNSQKIYLHLANNPSGQYGYLNLGGDTKLRGNGKHSSFDGSLGIGTVDPGNWKLAVNGKIRAKEIKVETGWSDFVFYDDYKLPSLQEVETHIKEKGHLKNIPSAKEVAENGILLGEMDSKLLQKIEELTLYTIQQQKELEELKKNESRVVQLETENKNLRKLASKLVNLSNRVKSIENKVK